jgi:hypothetical protein
VANFDFSSEKLPGTEYGLIRQKDNNNNNKNTPQYRRYPSNVQWDPEDGRLMALEIYLYQQKLDLTASLNIDDVLLTSRGVGDGDSSMTAGLAAAARDTTTINQEDLVKYFSNLDLIENLLISFQAESLIVSMFSTPDNQIFPKETFLRNASYRQLMAIKIPFYFFVTRVIEFFVREIL